MARDCQIVLKGLIAQQIQGNQNNAVDKLQIHMN